MRIPGFAPLATATPGVPRPSRKPYAVGVLFVHGMGEQERGDTVTEMGDALTEWLRQRLDQVAGADFKIRGALLRTGETVPSGQTDDTLGGQAHVAVTIFTKSRRGPPKEQDWLLAESWWAGAFRRASLLELVTWAIAAGPWLIASQRAGIGRNVRPNVIVAQILTLAAALVAAVITPLALALLLFSLVPVPVLSAAFRGLATNLTGSFGDLLVLVRSPVRFAAMAEQVRADIAHVSEHCDRVLVVAHSQGSAVAWHAIRRTAEDPPRQRARVDIFLSFGQAFRKLKSLYRLQSEPGLTQLQFAAAALLSTALLAVAAVQGVGLWNEVIAVQGDPGRVWSLLTAEWYWLRLLWPVVGVLVVQEFLGRLAGANDAATEGEILEDIADVQRVFPEFRWEDVWASADPAPNGPLLSSLPAKVDSYRIRNRASTVFDHSVYWTNNTEFVSAVAFAAASLAPPSALATQEAIPPDLQRAAVVRDQRVGMLAAGRVLTFGALVAGLIGLRRDLDDLGGTILDFANSIPLLPDWFGGWQHTLKTLAAAGALAVVAILVWSLLFWGWGMVIRDDERAFYARVTWPIWSRAARAWSVGAAGVPALAILALAAFRGDASLVVIYAVVAAAGILLVRWLNSPGRRFGEPRQAGRS